MRMAPDFVRTIWSAAAYLKSKHKSRTNQNLISQLVFRDWSCQTDIGKDPRASGAQEDAPGVDRVCHITVDRSNPHEQL